MLSSAPSSPFIKEWIHNVSYKQPVPIVNTHAQYDERALRLIF